MNKIIPVVLLLLILATIGYIIFLANIPNPSERFTEFYIEGPGGKAENYPEMVTLGNSVVVNIGIINHEQETTLYQMVVCDAAGMPVKTAQVELQNEEKWKQLVSFAPVSAGKNQKFELLLYKNNSKNPYLTLAIWLDVVK